jgi:hypothetical protein
MGFRPKGSNTKSEVAEMFVRSLSETLIAVESSWR